MEPSSFSSSLIERFDSEPMHWQRLKVQAHVQARALGIFSFGDSASNSVALEMPSLISELPDPPPIRSTRGRSTVQDSHKSPLKSSDTPIVASSPVTPLVDDALLRRCRLYGCLYLMSLFFAAIVISRSMMRVQTFFVPNRIIIFQIL